MGPAVQDDMCSGLEEEVHLAGAFLWSGSRWWVSRKCPGNASKGKYAGILYPSLVIPPKLPRAVSNGGVHKDTQVTGRAGGLSSLDTQPSLPPVSSALPIILDGLQPTAALFPPLPQFFTQRSFLREAIPDYPIQNSTSQPHLYLVPLLPYPPTPLSGT